MQASLSLYESTIGKKVAMAISGAILLGFVLVHMLGNLLVFAGPEVYNAYAATLQSTLPLLWGTRIVLLVAVLVHMHAAWSLVQRNRAARKSRYQVPAKSQATSYAAKVMPIGGVTLLAFIVYHLLHFTLGVVHPDYQPGNVHHNLLVGLQVTPVALFYLLAMGSLALHLYHGAWSFLQSLGLSHPRYNDLRKQVAAVYAGLVFVGNCSVVVYAFIS